MKEMLGKSYVLLFFIGMSLLAGFLFGYSRGQTKGRTDEQQVIIQNRVGQAFKAANSPKAIPLPLRRVDNIHQAQVPGVIYILGHRSVAHQKALFYQYGNGNFISAWLRPRSLSLAFGNCGVVAKSKGCFKP